MKDFESIIGLISEEESNVFNTLAGKVKDGNSELGGYMSPGEKMAVPSFFLTTEELENSFNQNVIEVIKNVN